MRRRFDWVYRDDIYDDTGALIETGGSYSSAVGNITGGPLSAAIKILYDSSNYIARVIGAGGVVPAIYGSAGRAEGRKPFIAFSHGTVFFTPSTWALGNIAAIGIRMAKFEQDPISGQVLIDPSYTMWSRTNQVGINPANHANSQPWYAERRIIRGFTENSAQFSARLAARVRTSLEPHQCLALWFENPGGDNPPVNSVSLVMNGCYFRTLVSDSSA